MKNIDVDLSRFNFFQSLSCIESYLLYILSANNYDYRHLYAQSYESFFEIMNYFFYERKQFEYYNGVPRLQQIASKYNIISIKNIDKPCIDIDSEHDYYLLRLCPKFIEATYGETIWRDDHYVLLASFNNSSWIYINDNPRDCKTLSHNEMLTAYAGSLIRIDLTSGITDKMKDILLQEFLDSMSENKKVCSTFSVDNIIAARNALAVLRILRRRIYEYCSQYICCDFMESYLNDLDKHFSLIEYMRLRNKGDYKKIESIFSSLHQKDSEFIETIKRKMCEQYGSKK